MEAFHTGRSVETVRASLAQLLTQNNAVTGKVDDASFRLQFKSGRRTIPVMLYGKVSQAAGGTSVRVRAFPHWVLFFWAPVWTWLVLRFDPSRWWFAILALVLYFVVYVREVSKAYELLRRSFPG
jgi:hypothetical protein